MISFSSQLYFHFLFRKNSHQRIVGVVLLIRLDHLTGSHTLLLLHSMHGKATKQQEKSTTVRESPAKPSTSTSRESSKPSPAPSGRGPGKHASCCWSSLCFVLLFLIMHCITTFIYTLHWCAVAS